jgi:hypothetical protein
VRSTAAPYTESRLTRSVANERVGFPVVEHRLTRSVANERVGFLVVEQQYILLLYMYCTCMIVFSAFLDYEYYYGKMKQIFFR